MCNYIALLKEAKKFSDAQTVLEAALARDPKNGQVKRERIRVDPEIDGLQAGLARARLCPGGSGKPPLRRIFRRIVRE
jgi:hypothetical protein